MQVESRPSESIFIASSYCNKTCPEECDTNWKFYNEHKVFEVDPYLSVTCGIIC